MTKIFVCGDIINRFSDEQFIEGRLVDIIQSADYSICNFEGVHAFEGASEISMLQKSCTIGLLRQAGFNMVLLANNHITDHGEDGLRKTIEKVDSLGLDRIGADFGYEQAYKPIIKDINGKRFGFVNLCEAQVGQYKSKDQKFGYAWIGDSKVDNRIIALRNQVDYLLVFPHAGLEHYSLPLSEFRQLYRHYIDLGADAVIASHPHVPQGIEIYNTKLISYSLGNFYFPKPDIAQNDPRNSSYSLLLSFNEDKVEFKPIYTRVIENKVELVEKPAFSLEELSANLCDSVYDTLIEVQNQNAFTNLVYRLYKEALVGTSYEDNLWRKIKFILKYLFFSKHIYKKSEKHRLELLKRLTENETYRYLTIKTIEENLR